jgi:thiamine transport system ATP-binding protein
MRPARGRIVVDGRDLAGVPPHLRGVGLMFQDGALFPHLDVAGNVAFGLRMDGASQREQETRAAELLELVGLAGAARREVDTLSGGERQRVALARTLAPGPRVLLLDEPLASLDGPLRERLLDDLQTLFDRLRPTVVHVTHDVAEAFRLGGRVAVMRGGRVVQAADPETLWTRPANAWVARFLGLRNVRENGGRLTLTLPEAVRLRPGDDGTVLRAERHGSTVRLRVALDGGGELEAVAATLAPPRPGARVAVEVDPAGVRELAPDPEAPS